MLQHERRLNRGRERERSGRVGYEDKRKEKGKEEEENDERREMKERK